MELSRRKLILGGATTGLILAAPAIVRAASLMPISVQSEHVVESTSHYVSQYRLSYGVRYDESDQLVLDHGSVEKFDGTKWTRADDEESLIVVWKKIT